MTEPIARSDGPWSHQQIVPEPPTPTRLDCQGCPVAAGEVPDASCAECVVTVFLSAEPWFADGG